ncbi:MAG: HEAT repeat domain-containing protein [Ardenticatenaceae bacterium]|nr:HEAT repeat domain-containing protein [Anaerolineales bacterium]MCB8937365.1 HEAT repeat domain-containing protein [Ardenticatenaceae bacterium]MCB8975440.1 HEAT repeat domain-containing protein [Ardenticatenaceae bacterium]
MKEEHDERPFADILAEIFGTDPLHIANLYRLSDMEEAEENLFWQGWTAVSDERRQAIVRHLADIVEDNFMVDFSPIFARSLQDAQPEVRVAALDGLWDATDLKMIPVITRLLQEDPDVQVRAAAAGSLGHYVLLAEWGQLPERILPKLIETMLAAYDSEDTAVSIRRVLLEGLGAADHPRTNDLIVHAYESGDQAMQMSAIFAMGNSADRRWSVTVLGEMQSPYEEMRAEAARAAGSIGNSDFVPQLAELAYDEDVAVQLAAIAALGQIGGDEVQRILADMLDDSEIEEDDELLDAVEEALEEAAMMAGDFDFGDFMFDDDESDDDL